MEMMQMDLGDAMGDSDSDTTVDMSNRQPSGMDTPPPREASPSLPQMEGYNPSDSFSDSSSNLLKPNFNSTHDDMSKGNVIDFSSSLEHTTSGDSGLLVPDATRRGASSVLDSLLGHKLKSIKKGGHRHLRGDRSRDGVKRSKADYELSDVSDDDAVHHPQVDHEGSDCNSQEIMDFGEDEPLMLTSEDEYGSVGNMHAIDSRSKMRSMDRKHGNLTDGGSKRSTRQAGKMVQRVSGDKTTEPTRMAGKAKGRFRYVDLDDESMSALAADRLPSEYDSQEEEETDASWEKEKQLWIKEKIAMEEIVKREAIAKEESEEEDDEDDDDEDDDDEDDEDDEDYEFYEEDEFNDEAIESLIKGEADEDGTDTPKTVDGDTEDEPSLRKRKRIVKKRKKKADLDGDDSADDSEGVSARKKKRRKKNKKKMKAEKEKEKEEKEKEKEGQRKGARKNIRKILTEDKLESATKDAQQEEFERKQRLQELRERLAYQQRVAEEGHSELKSLLEDAESDGKEDDIMVVSPKQLGKKEEKVEKGKGDEKGKKDEDVITLSSSDDDCKVVPSEPELEDEDDPDNSGLHVKDELNLPDEQGRVLVNLSHPPEEEDIFLAPQLAAAVKPHQIGGIRFLYDNLVESVERYKTSNGFGCILAHSMGLGKTIQLISFTDIFLRCTPARTALIIVPVNTLQNWLHEFHMWLPEEDADVVKAAPPNTLLPRKFAVFYINDLHKTPTARAEVVTKWVTEGGCLLMGYEMYRLLTSKKTLTPKPKRNKKNEIIDVEEEDKNKERLLKIQEALLKPGPDIVVCDEGHRIKNSHASISQALKNLKTKRRVVLTGYPLQNNLLEYWCMVDFVRPNYLGTKTEFSNMFERPIMNGQCVDSTPQDRKLMRYRSHVLHSLLSGFVQRRGHSVLKKALPPKEEHVIFIRMSPIQRQLYKSFMDSMQNESLQNMVSSNPLKAFSVCCKIWNHPDVLYKVMKARKGVDDDDLDIGEDLTPTPTTKKKGRGSKNSARSSGASTPAPTPPLQPPANPMSQFGPVGGMGGRMNTPPWNHNMNYGGPGPNPQGMYGMGPPGNMGPMGMGQPGPPVGQYGRNGPMGYGGPAGPMDMSQGMGQNMGPNGPMNMGQNSAMNMGQPMGHQGMGHPGMGHPGMGHQSMDHSGVPKNQGGPMGMGMNVSQNMGPQQQPDMASNNQQDMAPNGPHNMGMNDPHHMGPGGPQNMGPNSSHHIGPNGSHGMGSNGPPNMGPNTPQGMQPNGPENMGPNGPQGMGQNGPQNMGPDAPPNMDSNGPQTMGPHGPQNMGPHGPQNMGPHGPQNMGSHGPHNMGTQGPQNMGTQGPQNMGTQGPQNMGTQGPQNMGTQGPQNMGTQGPQNMGPHGPQNMGPGGQPNMNQNMSMGMNQASQMNMVPNGPQNMGSYNQMDPYNRSMGPYSQPMGMYDQPPMGGYNPYGQNMMASQSMERNQPYGANRAGMEMPGQALGPSGPYYGGPQNIGMPGPNSNMPGPDSMDNHNQLPGPRMPGGPPMEPVAPRHYGHYPKAITPPPTTSTDSKTTTSTSDTDKNSSDADTKKPAVATADSPTTYVKSGGATTTTTSSISTTPTPSSQEDKDKDMGKDKSKTVEGKTEDDAKEAKEKKEPNEISYEWAEPILKTYKRGMMENGGKIVLLMALIEETLRYNDKILVFSQSLFTLNLIEEYLQQSRIPVVYPGTEYWARNRSYFRLDGSTSGTERERLINQFNAPSNTNIHVFLLSTRAGCLGINLIGANRVVVLDASWNPCHDCQAVCRVYRYGQRKKCYVYRFVTDNTLEKKIYDRQINKQGMSDRVVDELQPQTNFTRNQVDTLLEYDDQDFKPIAPDEDLLAKFEDPVLKDIVKQYCSWITRPPFTHESLLIDKKEEKLTKTDKRLAKQGYEMEKKMNISYTRPSYSAFYQKDGIASRMPMARQVTIVYKKTENGEVRQVICIPTRQPQIGNRPIASVRPMMSTPVSVAARATAAGNQAGNIPVSSLLRPGVTVHQIQTTTDINIPSNAANNTGPQKIPAGETVLIIKTPKGVYIRTNNGKIFAVRSAPKGTEVPPSTQASTSATGAMKLAASSTATSPILQRTLTKNADPGKVTMLSNKSVTDLLSGGSLLANQRKDGTNLISRERMQILLQQGKIAPSKGMPVTLIRNPNMQMAKLGNPMGIKVPGGVRLIRPDKFASVQIAKAAAAAKAGLPNVDTKKEAAAIVADVLARYNENKGGVNPMVKVIKRDPKEEGVKTALIKDADGKLVTKILPPGMMLKPIIKDDSVKTQLLKDIEMVREKEMAKGKEQKAAASDLDTSVDGSKNLPEGPVKNTDKETSEKTEKVTEDKAAEPKNDTSSSVDEGVAQQAKSPKEIQRDKDNIGQWSQDIPPSGKVDTSGKDTVSTTSVNTSSTSPASKESAEQVNKESRSLLNKDQPSAARQENGSMAWERDANMFSPSSDDSGSVDGRCQMLTSQVPNYTASSQRSGGQYAMSGAGAGSGGGGTSTGGSSGSGSNARGGAGAGMNNYGGNQFDMNVQTSMAPPSSGSIDQQGTLDRGGSYSGNQFMGNQEFMERSSSNSSSMSGSQYGGIGGAGSAQGSGAANRAGSAPVSGGSGGGQSVASTMSSGGQTGTMSMNYSVSGQNMDGQFPMRNQYNDPMGNMNQNISNMDRPSGMMSGNMPPQTSVSAQMDIRRSDSIGSQSSMGSNSTIGGQFNMGGQPSGSLGSQSGLASQQPAMSGQFNNIGRDSIDKMSANSMSSPSSMASQFSMGSQPTMSRAEMGSTQNMGSPQHMGSTPNMPNSSNMTTPLNMGSTQSMRSSSNIGSSQSMGSSSSLGSRSQGMGRPSSMDSHYTDLGRAGSSDSQFTMGGSSQPSSQQNMSMPSESSKHSDLSSTPRDHSRSSSASSQHTTTAESRGMTNTKEPGPAKRHESKSNDRSADRSTRPSSTTSSKAESSPHSSSRSMDWSSNHTSTSLSVTNPPKHTSDSASSLLKEMVPPTTTQQSEHTPSYPSFSSSMSSPYGSTPGYSMPHMYPSHMGHSSSYGMSHPGLSPWYSGLSPWSAPPSYPGDPYAKHIPGSTPAMSSYPGMSGYSGYHGNTTTPKDKDGEKDRLSLSTTRHTSSSKDSLDMAGSAFDMQSSNPLTAMGAMSSMGSGPHSSGIGSPYHPQSSHSMQSSGMGSAYGAYPYHHMSPLPHPMYPPPPGSSSAYNYMSPYSGMPSTMMQHLPGSIPPLHPLSDIDPSRPPHMGP